MPSNLQGSVLIKPLIVLAVFFMLWFFGATTLSQAADQVVTNLNDTGAGSLRQAAADVGAGEEITFAVTGTITLTSGQITIAKSLTITGPGARLLTIDGDNNVRIFTHTVGSLSISGLNLTNISSDCISSVGLALSLSECCFEGVSGQGVYISGVTNGFSIRNCLFTNCHEILSGGGLYASNSSGSITNCTFTHNSASDSGGAMELTGSSYTIKISHCTITGNEAGNATGGILNTLSPVQIRNTIVAGNTDTSGYPNLNGDFESEGYNLIGDDNGADWLGTLDGTDRVDVADPKLCQLSDNGGSTNTHALLAGSLAVDNGVGTDIDGTAVTVDQRGAARPDGAGYDIGAFEGSVSSCTASGETDPDPDPDPIPPGGPANQLGGGGNNIGPPLPPGYTWQADQGGTNHGLNLVIAHTGERTGQAVSREFVLPGIIFEQTCPAGTTEQCWVALNDSGTMPSGVTYTTEVGYSSGAMVVNYNTTWPPALLQTMSTGTHHLVYYLMTSDGRKSNYRDEYMVLNADSATASFASAKANPVPLAASELTFKVQIAYFNESTGFVERVSSGLCIVTTEDGTWGSFPIADGLLTFTIPFGVTSKVGFNSVTFNGAKTVRFEFVDGYMYCYDQDHRDAVVEVYLCMDGESYAMEYYQDLVYICNQGDDPDGPILGRMYSK